MVLGGRESRSQGDGVDRDTQPAKETWAGHVGLEHPKPTSLQAIANKARAKKEHRFQNLYGMLDEALLLDTWHGINKRAAPGVDRVSAREYERDLEGNIRRLVERLRRKEYRAKLVRRHYIPKAGDQWRPLGIPVVEDKLLQSAVARLLQAIYEQDFLPCSYGYRESVGARDAADWLRRELRLGRFGYIVEADIQGFFSHIDHEWLVRMLGKRIDDKTLLEWLKAGVLETDGEVVYPEAGAPQGGSVSPVLSNVYLHYALDIWFERVVKPRCRGEAILCRYADDYVCAFRYQRDVQRFYSALAPRLRKFGLSLATAKTRTIPFNRHCRPRRSFEFLGFEFRWGTSRTGKAQVFRRIARPRLREALNRFTEWCKGHRHLRLKEQLRIVNAKLRGHYHYYGVHGNLKRLWTYFFHVVRTLFKWLNRRSQRRSYSWTTFAAIVRQLQRPRIIAPGA